MKNILKTLLVFAFILPVAFLFGGCTKTFKIDYMFNGELYKTVYVKSDEPVRREDGPQLEGYIFDGWYLSESSDQKYDYSGFLKGNIKLYARHTKAPYSITYHLDGGTNNAENPETFDITTQTIVLQDPSKTGYDFLGWFKDAELTQQINSVEQGTHANIEVWAKWQVQEFTLTFNSNGGTEVAAMSANYNESITAPEDPSKTAYDFAGWYKDQALLQQFDFTTMPAENLTLYAKWTAHAYTLSYSNLNKATIIFNGEQMGTKASDYKTRTVTYTIEDDLTLLPVSKEYCSRVYWEIMASRDAQGQELPTGNWSVGGQRQNEHHIGTGRYGDITLWLRWEWEEWTVEFVNANPEEYPWEEAPANMTVEYTQPMGKALPIPTTTTVGYVFDGWYNDPTKAKATKITSETASSSYAVKEDAEKTFVLYARWVGATITLTLNGNGGMIPQGQGTSATVERTVNFGVASKSLPTPARDNYTFLGWRVTEGLDSTYAKWGDSKITVTEVLTAEKLLQYNDWFMNINTGGEATLTAVWAPTPFTITYELNGGTNNAGNPATYTIESETITLLDPTKEGYNFAGWNNGTQTVETIPTGSTGNITLTALWELVTESVWDGTACDLPAEDNNIITISTAQEFAAFRDAVNAGNTFEGKTILLDMDIDLANIEWTPIGYGDIDHNGTSNQLGPIFKGTFDGQNHTIHNLKITTFDQGGKQTGAAAGVALFGQLLGTVQNLSVDGAVVSGNHFVGVIAGYALSATIDNCHVSNAVVHCVYANDDNESGDKAGAIVGYTAALNDLIANATAVTNCSATNCQIDAYRDAGQLIGCMHYGTQSDNTATDVTVTANHSHDDAKDGQNINQTIVGRVVG